MFSLAELRDFVAPVVGPPGATRRRLNIGAVVAVLILAVFVPSALLVGAQMRTILAAKLAAEAARVEAAAAAFRTVYRTTLAQDLDRLTELAGRLPPQHTSECDALLSRAIAFQPHHGNLLRYTADGHLACAAERGAAGAISDRAYFRRGKHATGPYVSEIVLGAGTGRPLQMIIVPLRSETGVFDGVLVAEFRLDWLAERVLASQILTDVPTQALSVTLFDRLGRIEHSAPSDASGGAVVRELARQMSTGAATRTLVRAASASGEARIYALAALDAAKGIVLAVGLPESASVQRAEALRANSVVTLALLGVAILVLALRIGHITLVRPIRALAQHAQELAQGTAGGGQAPSDGPREVRDLGRELTALAAALTQRNRRLAAKNAELQRADRELKAFTYNASHGLQQPLDVLGGVLDAFARGERMSPANRDAVAQDARDALARIRRQLRETLLFSEVMRDDVGPDAGTALDLAELVRDVRSTLNDEMAGGEITVEPLPRIVAHAGLMKELFRHLLENAVVHAAPSPVRVRQGTRHDPEWIVVDIEDAGPGIAPEDQNTIFQPFRRVGQSTAGSGIGLSLAMRIAMRHGGHITLSSVPGQGATFHVHLPANLLVSRAAT